MINMLVNRIGVKADVHGSSLATGPIASMPKTVDPVILKVLVRQLE
jgi:hypothetical protein